MVDKKTSKNIDFQSVLLFFSAMWLCAMYASLIIPDFAGRFISVIIITACAWQNGNMIGRTEGRK
jgi:hypothetical protein